MIANFLRKFFNANHLRKIYHRKHFKHKIDAAVSLAKVRSLKSYLFIFQSIKESKHKSAILNLR